VREISEINLILPVGVGGVEANNDTSPQSVWNTGREGSHSS
jgi:hypothetical protein